MSYNNIKLTIGVFVRNEEKYIEETILNILKQTNVNHEIIIADNNSTDNTYLIAESFAEKDTRIKLIKHPRNIGAIQNWNSLVNNARGEFFISAGAHDLWSDNYIHSLIQALDNDKEAVLAYAPTKWIDEYGTITNKKSSFIDTSGLSPLSRFNICMWGNQHALYGAFRLSALRKTRLGIEMVGNGAVLLSELALFGTFIVVPTATWYRREIRISETHSQRLKRYQNQLYSKPEKHILPHWKIPFAYTSAAYNAKNLSVSVKILLICSAILNSLIIHCRSMLYDILRLIRPN